MRETEVLINGLKINYKIAGEGPAILILHGWGGSSDSWIKVQRILAEKGYKVIIPDFPGFGKSIAPPEPWGVKEYADFILNFAKEMKIDRFFLIGHSFGGRIAVKLAIQHSESVKNLILCDSAGIKPKPDFKTRTICRLAGIGNAIFAFKFLKKLKNGVRNIFYISIRNKDYAKTAGVMRETIKKVLDEDLLSDLSEIKTAALIVWGGNDKMVPLKYARIFNREIKNSKLEILPKVGHSPHLEVPEIFSEIILKFLR